MSESQHPGETEEVEEPTVRPSSEPPEAKSSASEQPPADDDRQALIEARGLYKVFKIGLFVRKTVRAVQGVSFRVNRGEIFGFLGPNGSGKTTTIKILTGLIRATGGEAFLFGQRVPSLKARQKVGFLPENPYVYPYLTPREFVAMCGRLSGLSLRLARSRTEEVLDKVGVLYAADRQVRRLSKGMLQRSCLAAAMVADPELLILDEPMSGLDPVGRKEVRDILLSERDGGRTIFFSTHILSDVESVCDHVTILRQGKVVESGALRTLLKGDVMRTDITIAMPSDDLGQQLANDGFTVHHRADVLVVEVEGEQAVQALLKRIIRHKTPIIEVTPRRETLEDLFMRRAIS